MLDATKKYGPTIIRWGLPTITALSVAKFLAYPTYLHRTLANSQPAKELFPDIFEKIKDLRNDILLCSSPASSSFMEAYGANFWGFHAVVVVNKELQKIVPKAAKLMLLHEFCHIYYSDAIRTNMCAAIASLTAAFVMPYFQRWLPWWAAPITYIIPTNICIYAFIKVAAPVERTADQFAITYAENEDFLEMELFLKVLIDTHVRFHEQKPEIFTSEGNIHPSIDFLHPPLTERLANMSNLIAIKNLKSLDQNSEQGENIKKFLEKLLTDSGLSVLN